MNLGSQWDQLGRKTRANHHIIYIYVRDLTRALQQEWRNFPQCTGIALRYVDAAYDHCMHSCKWWPHSVLTRFTGCATFLIEIPSLNIQ